MALGLGRGGAAVAFAALVAVQAWANEAPAWSYSGKSGPEHWGKLARSYQMCAIGKNQSPIDINRMEVLRTELRPIEFHYETPLPLTVVDRGWTVAISVPEKERRWRIRAEREFFALTHIEFRSPSEHSDGGNRYPLEAQLFHRNDKGELAVVAVWFREGDENPVLTQLLNAAQKLRPVAEGKRRQGRGKQISEGTVELRALLPKSEGFFRYNGSLTIPPCTEGVRWYVMQEAVPASREQLQQMHELLDGNARPVQPLNARRVLE